MSFLVVCHADQRVIHNRQGYLGCNRRAVRTGCLHTHNDLVARAVLITVEGQLNAKVATGISVHQALGNGVELAVEHGDAHGTLFLLNVGISLEIDDGVCVRPYADRSLVHKPFT